MFRSKGEDRSALIMGVKKRAFQLGLEVGENNHVENVGWVKASLNSIKAEAEELGASSEVIQKYLDGKKLGASRRSRRTSDCQGAGRTVCAGSALPSQKGSTARAIAATDRGTFVERITPKEGLESTISVMKFVAKNPEVKKDLDGLFAGIFDIQERLLDMRPEPEKRKTFERCMQLLVEVGWIENCDVGFFDEERAVVTLKSTTAIANAFAGSLEPMCRPICNLLETIGRKTFQRSVIVTEIECVAQGKAACKFEISPRAAATSTG